jgi:small-conductance mechanosensitive channel
MIERFLDVARAFVAVLVLGTAGAAAQTGQPSATPGPDQAPRAGAPSTAPATAQPAPPQIDTADITSRANRDVGVDIQATITGWQRELDRLESDLQRQRLRYSELNNLRDDVQRIRAAIQDFWSRLEPPLTAAKAQVDLLGPAPAAGQPPEPEQGARTRAELNYFFGLLTAGQAAVQSANLRLDNIINAIQDIRRKNFATNLFQPVPGIYAYQTWARLPDYVPLAMSRVGDLMSEWWDSVSDRDDVEFIGFEAILMWLVLASVAWYGVRRLRRWRNEEEPPFWRRASSAAGVILLRSVPIIFLYSIIAEAHALPQRVDWLFYSAAQSIIVVAAVNALVFTVLAPRASQWRLIPASDRAARRICGLVLALTLVYGAATVM